MPVLSALMTLQSCGLIFDDSDCVESSNLVKFVYTHNMNYTCGLDREVEHLTLFLFDAASGELKERLEVPHALLNDDNELALNVAPGDYDILVWAGNHSLHYDLGSGAPAKPTLADIDCYMHRTVRTDGTHHVEEKLENLYYGKISVSLPYASPSKPNRFTIPLQKNTNTIRLVLQELSEGPVTADDYEVVITDPNGWMNADNSLRGDETLTYHHFWNVSGSVDVNDDPQDAPGNARSFPTPASRSALGASLWEFKTGRLMTDNKTMLSVYVKGSADPVLSISVRDYAMLVKGFDNKDLDDQEYLDRQDQYNLTLFLDHGKWMNNVVIINNWRIVRNDAVLE